MENVLHKKIPDKLVVLTFDDGCKSQATFVGPLLKSYGFGSNLLHYGRFEFSDE